MTNDNRNLYMLMDELNSTLWVLDDVYAKDD